MLKIFSSKDIRYDLPCPACESNDIQNSFNKNGFGYVLCNHCGTLYQSPRPSIEAFEKFYVDSPSSNYWAEVFFPQIAEARRNLIFKPRVDQISKYCDKKNIVHNTVMDVGAGYGIFLEEWRKQHPDNAVCAIEPGTKLAEVCREKKLDTLSALAEHAEVWADKGDLTTCFEVIEHVRSPLDFIKSLKKLTKPGGSVLISGLGVDGFDIQVLWEHSKSISPPHHINFMSVKGFEMLFEKAGFIDIDVLTPGKLDVEIVSKALDSSLKLTEINRFAVLLNRRGSTTQNDFQKFLIKHRMSSHVWVFAKRPTE